MRVGRRRNKPFEFRDLVTSGVLFWRGETRVKVGVRRRHFPRCPGVEGLLTICPWGGSFLVMQSRFFSCSVAAGGMIAKGEREEGGLGPKLSGYSNV